MTFNAMYSDFLFLIPARGGSKGIKKKNIKLLAGKPLLFYTLDSLKNIAPVENICISTDDDEIISIVEKYGFKVPFKRPAELATDTSGTLEVIQHAVDFYLQQGKVFKALVLLQPTSPFRNEKHIAEAIEVFNYSSNADMVVSVKITSSNPYFVLFEENKEGFLELSKKSNFTRRQDCPVVYERNGAIYIYTLDNSVIKMERQIKYIMNEYDSIDLDTDFDWFLAESIINREI